MGFPPIFSGAPRVSEMKTHDIRRSRDLTLVHPGAIAARYCLYGVDGAWAKGKRLAGTGDVFLKRRIAARRRREAPFRPAHCAHAPVCGSLAILGRVGKYSFHARQLRLESAPSIMNYEISLPILVGEGIEQTTAYNARAHRIAAFSQGFSERQL